VLQLIECLDVKSLELLYNPKKVVESVVERLMNDLAIPYNMISNGRIVLTENLNQDQAKALTEALSKFSIKIAAHKEEDLIENIKDCIRMVVENPKLRKKKISSVVSEKLGYSYSHLSNLFSSKTYTSIEHFYIFTKIEMAKELLMSEKKTLADVAHELDYSSVAHLSRQFKKVTGLTVSQYLNLISKRRKAD